MTQAYKNNQEVQQDLQDIKRFLTDSIEEDFDPIKIKMFMDFDVQEGLFKGTFVGSNDILYDFKVDNNGVTTLTRK